MRDILHWCSTLKVTIFEVLFGREHLKKKNKFLCEVIFKTPFRNRIIRIYVNYVLGNRSNTLIVLGFFPEIDFFFFFFNFVIFSNITTSVVHLSFTTGIASCVKGKPTVFQSVFNYEVMVLNI